MAQRLKRLPGMRETPVRSLGWEDPLEKEMATHSSTLAWRIPWREEPGRLHGVTKNRTWLCDFTSLHFLGNQESKGVTSKRCLDSLSLASLICHGFGTVHPICKSYYDCLLQTLVLFLKYEKKKIFFKRSITGNKTEKGSHQKNEKLQQISRK